MTRVTFREFVVASAGFVVLSVAFCASVVFQPSDVAPFATSDAQASFFPYYARSFHPLSKEVAGDWDPTLWTGLPESHSPFARYLPTVWILCELLPLGAALTWIYVLHHALAGLGTYLLTRTSGFSKCGSMIAGIAFSFGGFIILHRPFVPMFLTCVWLPWVFWSLEMFRHTRKLVWVASAGTFLACHVLGAHSQMIVMSAPMWVLYGIYFSLFSDESKRQRVLFASGVLAACVIGVIGGLPQLLPMMEVGSWTPYHEFNFDYFKNGSFEFRWLPGLAGPWVLGERDGIPGIPNYQGNVECGCFFGLLPLALAVIGAGVCLRRLRRPACGLALAPSRRDIGFWCLVFTINLLLAFGRNTPLYRAMAWVPIYNMFHVPARHLWIVSLVVAWLSAMGFDELRSAAGEMRRRFLLQVLATFAILLAISLVVIVPHKTWTPKPGWSYSGFVIPAVSAACILLMLTFAWLCRLRAGLLVIGIAVAIELRVSFGEFFLSPFQTRTLLAEEKFPETVRWLRGQSASNQPLPRCIVQPNWVPPGLNSFAPSAFGSTWRLSVLNCYSQSMPGSLATLLALNKYGEVRFHEAISVQRGLSACGGRFIVCNGVLPAELAKGYSLKAICDGQLHIYENLAARPLAIFVEETRAAMNDMHAAASVLAGTDRPVVELAYVTKQDLARRYSTGKADVVNYLPNDFRVRTTNADTGFLALTVTRCRGWSATVDGTQVPIHAVDGPLMGIVVPAGEHEVRLQFRPVLLMAGMTAAGIGLGSCWFLVITIGLLRRRRGGDRRHLAFYAHAKAA